MKKITVDADDGIRPQYTTPEKLKKLPAVFKKGGTTTVGNASQVTDPCWCPSCLLLPRDGVQQ